MQNYCLRSTKMICRLQSDKLTNNSFFFEQCNIAHQAMYCSTNTSDSQSQCIRFLLCPGQVILRLDAIPQNPRRNCRKNKLFTPLRINRPGKIFSALEALRFSQRYPSLSIFISFFQNHNWSIRLTFYTNVVSSSYVSAWSTTTF